MSQDTSVVRRVIVYSITKYLTRYKVNECEIFCFQISNKLLMKRIHITISRYLKYLIRVLSQSFNSKIMSGITRKSTKNFKCFMRDVFAIQVFVDT